MSIEKWYMELPPFTKYYLTGAVGTTILLSLGMVSPYLFMWSGEDLVKSLQIWRILTPFLVFGKFGFPFIIDMAILVQFTKQLELTSKRVDYASFVFMVILLWIQILVYGFVADIPFLGKGLSFALIYIWSKRESESQVRLMFGFTAQAWHLPFILLAFKLLSGEPIAQYLVGLVAGHLYYFLSDIVPQDYGKQIIQVPRILYNYFPRADQPRNQTGPFAGRGQRLGGQLNSYQFGKDCNKMSLLDFEKLRKLGDGAYSVVFKVRRKSDNQIYALKQVRFAPLKQREKHNALNEVRILASLNHPNIVQYKEAFVDNNSNSLCLIMEYAEQGDLLQLINQHKQHRTTFSERQIWSLIQQTIRGLKELHRLKILHRDLKSANIFLFNNDVIKIGDMNVSKINKRGMAYTQTGTPYYASPEVWKDLPYDEKSDIWSLGCVIYEMATLQPPFKGQDMQQLYRSVIKGQYPPLPSQYSQDLKKFIRCLLQVNPLNRPTAEQTLELPHLLRNSQQPQIEEDQQSDLLKTIKIPRHFSLLSKQLPSPKYHSLQNRLEEQQSLNTNFSTPKLPQLPHQYHRMRANKALVHNAFKREFKPIYPSQPNLIRHSPNNSPRMPKATIASEIEQIRKRYIIPQRQIPNIRPSWWG